MHDVKTQQDLVSGGLDRIREVAEFLKICTAQVYRLMENGSLPYMKLGKSRRIPHRAVVELAAANLTKVGVD